MFLYNFTSRVQGLYKSCIIKLNLLHDSHKFRIIIEPWGAPNSNRKNHAAGGGLQLAGPGLAAVSIPLQCTDDYCITTICSLHSAPTNATFYSVASACKRYYDYVLFHEINHLQNGRILSENSRRCAPLVLRLNPVQCSRNMSHQTPIAFIAWH